MAATYFDILFKRGIRPFLSDENFEILRNYDPREQYVIPTTGRGRTGKSHK